MGFGAKLPPSYVVSSSCFAVNGNIFDPSCPRVKGLLKTYRKGIQQIVLHGPAAHAPVVKYVVDLISLQEPSQENQFYNILVIITRGVISDA